MDWIGAAKAVSSKGLEVLFPRLVRTLETDPDRHRHIRLKRLIAFGRVVRARRRGDDVLQAALGDLWRTPAGDEYHIHHSGDVHAMFKERHRFLLTDFRVAALDAGQPFSRLVEIGCGVGRLLGDCQVACPGIASFVGLDLNPYAIERARSEADPATNLHFEQAEAVSWLEKHPVPGTVLVSYNGVMEYLSRDAVSRILTELARHPPAAVLICEPVAPDHDLERNVHSYPFGAERSFSHNHEALLKEAGFRIVTAREDFHEGSRTRLKLVVAIATDEPGNPRYDGSYFEGGHQVL